MANILVVEDEPTIREVVCDILGHSHHCRAVRTAEEGLMLLSSEHFDLAITDVHLPGMGGEEFLGTALGLRPGLPVIVITGADGDEGKFMEAGAYGHLLKPFRLEELDAMVAGALSARA